MRLATEEHVCYVMVTDYMKAGLAWASSTSICLVSWDSVTMARCHEGEHHHTDWTVAARWETGDQHYQMTEDVLALGESVAS